MASTPTRAPEIPHPTRSFLLPYPWPSPHLRFPSPFWHHLGALSHARGAQAAGGACVPGKSTRLRKFLRLGTGCPEGDKTKSPAECAVPECVRACVRACERRVRAQERRNKGPTRVSGFPGGDRLPDSQQLWRPARIVPFFLLGVSLVGDYRDVTAVIISSSLKARMVRVVGWGRGIY